MDKIAIIVSPAKKMKKAEDVLPGIGIPHFICESEKILESMQQYSYDEMKEIWQCSDSIAKQEYVRIRNTEKRKLFTSGTPAILAYDGIQYKYMAPAVFDYDMLSYVQNHLWILSGFYGCLRPMDRVIMYRLEMQAKFSPNEKCDSLYDFWGDRIYRKITEDADIIINLASKEYSKLIEKYMDDEKQLITCVFGEVINGKLIQKGTHAKMARGQMVRYMAEEKIENVNKIKEFSEFGYKYDGNLSSKTEFVFLKVD